MRRRLAHPFGGWSVVADRVRLLVQHQMIIAEIPTRDVPVEVLGLHVEHEGVGRGTLSDAEMLSHAAYDESVGVSRSGDTLADYFCSALKLPVTNSTPAAVDLATERPDASLLQSHPVEPPLPDAGHYGRMDRLYNFNAYDLCERLHHDLLSDHRARHHWLHPSPDQVVSTLPGRGAPHHQGRGGVRRALSGRARARGPRPADHAFREHQGPRSLARSLAHRRRRSSISSYVRSPDA